MKTLFFSIICFSPFLCFSQNNQKTKKCIQVNEFIKYYGDKETTIKKPMCACYDENHNSFEIKSKGEITLLFHTVGYEVTRNEPNFKVSTFDRDEYGGRIGKESCDVSIIETPKDKSFWINFSQLNFGYRLTAKGYTDKMLGELTPPPKVTFPNDSVYAPYNIDSFVNHTVKWGNGLDTGSLGFAYVYFSVNNKGEVKFESIGGQGRDENKIAHEYMKIEKINEKLSAIFSNLPNWKVKIKGKELHGIYYLTLRNK